jgi:tetratricopeptide (TPR) repeat protein
MDETMTTNRILLLSALLLGTLVQTACTETVPEKQETVASVEAPDPAALRRQRIAAEDLSPRERVARALDLFQTGQQEDAREHLLIALEEKPRYRLARKLLDQFEGDPEEMLGRESFDYRVKSGESLSLIAERFLGDQLEFIILARYNRLQEPARLAAGQTLQIPARYKPKPKARQASHAPKPEPAAPAGAEPKAKAPPMPVPPASPAAQAQPTSQAEADTATPLPIHPEAQPREATKEDPSDALFKAAGELFRNEDYTGAIAQLEPAVEGPFGQDPRLAKLLSDAYGARAAKASARKDWQAAREDLARAVDLAPDDRQATASLAEVEDKIEAQRLYALGQAQQSQGQLEEAYQAFRDASVYDPGNSDYARAKQEAGQQLAQDYHRSALRHYHREQLDQAKAYWRKVLEVDPLNRIAPGYLSKVEEIQRRLREVEGQ